MNLHILKAGLIATAVGLASGLWIGAGFKFLATYLPPLAAFFVQIGGLGVGISFLAAFLMREKPHRG